jgi:multiple sugar transport system substrate-binding protein
MKLLKAITTIGAVASLLVSAGAAMAADLNLYSDQVPWHDGMAGLASIGSKASGINITLQEITPTDKYQAFMQTSLASNNLPAMFKWWNGNQLSDLVSTGAVADLSSYWDQAIRDGNFTPQERDLVSVDGKPYGILLNVADWVVFYNTHDFEKAGIAAPPKTWAELMADCDKLKAAGFTPFNAPASGGWMPFIWFSQLVLGTNPDAFVGLTSGKVPYNGPEVHKAFQLWEDMYKKGYFTDPREQDDSKFFANGSAAMFLIGDWHSGSFATAGMKPGVDFKSFLMPSVTPDVPQSIIVEASPIVVSKAALDNNAGLGKAVAALMQPDASNMLGKTVQVYNGNLKGTPPNAIVAADNQLVADAKPRQLVRWWEAVPPQIQGDLVAQMGSFMLNPTPANGEKVMDQMQQINSDYWANK